MSFLSDILEQFFCIALFWRTNYVSGSSAQGLTCNEVGGGLKFKTKVFPTKTNVVQKETFV